jgi:ribosomal-protein-alanine N-acetyltransferase
MPDTGGPGGGAILARLNLVGIDAGSAELGYRVAPRAAGRGVATAAVRVLCDLAGSEYGLRVLRARTTLDNIASQKVLAKPGFNPVGEADVGGRNGIAYERSLPHPDR